MATTTGSSPAWSGSRIWMARRRKAALVKFKGQCVDCGPGSSPRVVARPGPRCQTHRIARRNKLRSTAHDAYVLATYNITGEEYWALYEAQGGKCYVCQRATGATKRLSVDHDHACCPGATSCGNCVRGLLCSTDNSWYGHIRDQVPATLRATEYLINPPAKAVLAEMRKNVEDVR